MNSQKAKTSFNAEEINDFIIECIRDIKGKNILKLDLRKLEEAPTDFFIICEGDSTTQISAIANNIKSKLKQEMGLAPFKTEGFGDSRWVLVDYFTTVVHVFYPEVRAFYELEDLWSDGESTSYEEL